MRILTMSMTSCLGPLVTACAAFRAGIMRHRPSVYASTFTPGDREPQPIHVCEVPDVTLGFMGTGRLVALALDALEDLRTRVSLEFLCREAGLFLALPDLAEPGASLEVRDAAAAKLGRRIFGQALAALGLSWPENRWKFFMGDSAGFALALAAARDAMERRTFETVVVGGIDSLVEASCLQALRDEQRLKTADNPVGLIPGEAGALLVLRARTRASSKEKTPTVEIAEIHTAVEARGEPRGPLPDGTALATCVQAVLGTSPGDDVAFVCDLTGEQRRAWEWGCALVRLRSLSQRLGEAQGWVPATGFGYVGAASGAVGACLAARSLERRYAPAHRIIVISQADSGERAAFALTAQAPLHSGGVA